MGDLQNLADRLDPEALAGRVDETVNHLLRWSSSACAKYALAKRRISLAFFNSRTSRSSVLDAGRVRRGDSITLPGVALVLANPVRWRLRTAADFGGDQFDCCSL